MRRPHAFTVIELLVVIAIIILLLSIAIPSLSPAREQARVVTCLSNLRNIGQAATMYLGEFPDLPWALGTLGETGWTYTVDGHTYEYQCISEFVWGGGKSAKKLEDWLGAGQPPELGPYRCEIEQFSTQHRPMNRYLFNSVSFTDPGDIPGVFRCPSDSSIAVPWVGIDNSDIEGDTPYSSWSFFGSSYPSNWYWPYYYMQAPPGSGPVYKGDFRNIIGAGSPDVPFGLGRDMLRGKSGRWASEFITFYENRLNYAMEGAEPPGGAGDGPSLSKPKSYRGWHKKWDMHAAVFLDGSSRNQKFDTRFVWGNNWTTWPNKPWRGSWEQFNELPPPD